MNSKPSLSTLVLCLSALSSAQADTSPSPWTLHDAVGLPDWLKLSIEHRSRYETVDDTFKKNASGGDQVVSFRTLALIEANYQNWRLGAEFIDSRLALEDSGTPISTAMVNQTDLLQAYLAWDSQNFMDTGLSSTAKFGRQTMDFGSRRLIARNRYRNTINNFTGLDWQIGSYTWQWRNFVTLPVSRLPSDAASLYAGKSQFDEESFDTIFAGSFFSINNLIPNATAELYFYQLSEDDTHNTPSRNRQISTPGFRVYQKPQTGGWDYEIEGVLQTGTIHASTTDNTELDHFAYLGHAQFGYSFDAPWKPRLILQYDYASGDEDPNDGKNGRFDTLYGGRRFDFGPTSMWGSFARANINSPGLRLLFQPAPSVSGMLSHRVHWLAEKKDAWVGSGLRDTSGKSGRYIGQQLEARFIWKAIPKQLTFETGWAHLFKGDVAENAPNAPTNNNDSDYFYAGTTVTF